MDDLVTRLRARFGNREAESISEQDTMDLVSEAADALEKMGREKEHLLDVINGISRQTSAVVNAHKPSSLA